MVDVTGLLIKGQARAYFAHRLQIPALHCHPAQDGFNPYLQLGHAEGLGQIVVGATLKARNTIRFSTQRRHQDNRRGRTLAQARQYIKAIHARQQNIHQHHVETPALGDIQAVAAVLTPRDLEAAAPQLLMHKGTKHRVVFDGKDTGSANRYGSHWRVLVILNW
ncbi:hypothetical protein D3C76_779880 [compost metagenome]